MKRTLVLALVLLLSLSVLANGSSSVTTIILVRHAEKSSEGTDPVLTPAGVERAKELARVIGSNGISAIYTTDLQRTRQTAAPVAAALNVTPVEIKPGATFAADMAARIRKDHAGATVLVVGHSNTTQQVIRALGIADAPKIEESEFDNLFIVTLAEGSEPKLLKLRYGTIAR
jgi:2,3-bisphosphoglycerate-dependent phosphoglycerate mutase